MSYLIQIDDLFTSKSTTIVGSGSNSVGVNGTSGIGIPTTVNSGNGGTSAGWVDYTGNLWQITANGADPGHTNSPPNSGTAGALYRPSGENYQDGYVRAWPANTGAVNDNPVVTIGRFSPASGGTFYQALFYSLSAGTLFIGKVVNGTRTFLASGVTMTGTPPTGTQPVVCQMTLTQTNSTTTTILCQVYLQSDTGFTSPILTYSITDTETTLQNVSGSWGLGVYSECVYTRAQLAHYAAGGTFTSGNLVANLPAAGKTATNLVGTAATGGTTPYSYQLHRSQTSGFTPTWSGGTLIQSPTGSQLAALTDSTVSPGQTYYYILMCQDSEGTPVTLSTSQVAITTLPSNAVICGFVGDSLTFGAHASVSAPSGGNIDTSYSAPAEFCFLANANANNNDFLAYNMGVSGSTTANWLPGQADYIAAAAIFALAQVTDVFIMLGTNDARTGVSAATYGSNIASIVAGLLSISGVQRVHLNFPTYDKSAGGDESLLITYLPQLQSLANGHSIFMGDSAAHYTIYDSPVNLYYTGDYIHLIDPGYVSLGYCWWRAYSGLVLPKPAGSVGSLV